MDAFDAGQITPKTLDEIAAKQAARFVKTPHNVKRHVVVSDIKVGRAGCAGRDVTESVCEVVDANSCPRWLP